MIDTHPAIIKASVTDTAVAYPDSHSYTHIQSSYSGSPTSHQDPHPPCPASHKALDLGTGDSTARLRHRSPFAAAVSVGESSWQDEGGRGGRFCG